MLSSARVVDETEILAAATTRCQKFSDFRLLMYSDVNLEDGDGSKGNVFFFL